MVLTKGKNTKVKKILNKYTTKIFKNSKLNTKKFELGLTAICGLARVEVPKIVYLDSYEQLPSKQDYNGTRQSNMSKIFGVAHSVYMQIMHKAFSKNYGIRNIMYQSEGNIFRLRNNYYNGDAWNRYSYMNSLLFTQYLALFDSFKVADESIQVHEKDYSVFKYLSEANFEFLYMDGDTLYVVKPPIYRKYNENQEFSSVEGKAIEFLDGSGYYFINGFKVEEELFLKLQENRYTVADFAHETNEEIKSAVVSFFQLRDGEEGVYNFFKDSLSEVDSFKNSKAKISGNPNVNTYTLYKGKVNHVEVAYVKCYCPSTDRVFFLGVETKHSNAKDAIASLYLIPSNLKDNIISISRQGEKFITIFDEETTKELTQYAGMGDDKLSGFVSLTGDEYFKLLKQEA